MVTAKEVSHAWTRIKPYVLRTPVLETDVFGMPLSLKLEQMQHTGSFKARGAMNSLLSMDVPKSNILGALRICRRGFMTASIGCAIDLFRQIITK